MKRLDEWFSDYGQSHRHPVNVAIHKVAVPGIYLCALALLWCLPAGPLPPSLNWAALVAMPVLAFYLQLSFSLFVGMAALTALGLALCFTWHGPLLRPALVLGAEGPGMRQLTRKTCDELVHLPMRGAVESLNVSVASGVCLYEALRQRSL